MTLQDVVQELMNWSRWRWAGLPDLSIPEPPAFELWRPYGDGREEGWGTDHDPAPASTEIDEPAAEAMHDLIWKLANNHRSYIYDHWYLRLRVHHSKLESAHVAIMDMMNRWECSHDRQAA